MSSPTKSSKQRNNDIIIEYADGEDEESKFEDAVQEISKKFQCTQGEVYMV
jgi:hypothetical protein